MSNNTGVLAVEQNILEILLLIVAAFEGLLKISFSETYRTIRYHDLLQ
jgi:hypothetical protein